MSEFMGWTQGFNQYFGKQDVGMEKLQKPWPKDSSYDLVETSYFGFSIPEENINCEIYHWFHPVFNVASGGVYIFKGKTLHQMTAEYMDFRNYQPLPEDITDCTYEDGVTVKMIKPLEEFDVSFNDEANQTSIQLNTKAIMPPAFRPNGGHITQAMKTRGKLVLKGKPYEIDGYFTRDRSWGAPRTEKILPIAPAGWHVGVFDDKLAFHVMGFDTPEFNEKLASRYPGTESGKNFIWGYIWKEDKLLGIKACEKTTVREADGVTADRLQLKITDENDHVYRINGTLESYFPLSIWPNFLCAFGITRWEMDGRVGYGDTQEAFYHHFLRENLTIANPHLQSSKPAGN